MKRSSQIAMLLATVLVFGNCGGGGGGGGGKKKKPAPPPTFSLQFNAPGGSGFADGIVSGLLFSAAVTQNFQFSTGISVTGTVRDSSGTPMAGVDVTYRATAGGPALDGAGTNAMGVYTVVLPAGTWLAEVDSNLNSLGEMAVSGVVVAAPGPVTQNFSFPATVSVSGTVRDSSLNPIAGALVSLEGASTGANANLVADVAGAYSTNLVPDTYTATVTPVGGAAATHLKEKVSGILVSGATVRDFTLQLGSTVSGTIFNNLGAPLLKATDVKVIVPNGSAFFAPADVSANPATGQYSIGPVPPGSMTFELEAPGDSGFPRQRFTRNILGGAPQTENFTLAAGFVLSGTVTRSNATPEDNADIVLTPSNGSLAPDGDNTDAAGFYEISLFAGTYTLEIRPQVVANLQAPKSMTITVTANTVQNVTLELGAMLQGTVRKPDGITAAPNIKVKIAGVWNADSTTNAAGSYSFLAPAGTHTLTLTDTGGVFEDMPLDPVTGVVVTTPGPITQDITLVLSTTGSTVVQGTVVAPDGVTPVAGVEVIARNQAGDRIGRAITSASGAYLLVIK